MFKNIKTAEQLASQKLNRERIARAEDLRRKLAETDYIALPDYDKEKPQVIEQRAAWRAELREIEPLIIPEDEGEE